MTWKKGETGNASGRPPGTGRIARMRAALDKDLSAVLDALIAQAKAGDTAAARLILERTIPALRPVDASTPLDLPAEGGLVEQGRAVLAALAAGQLPVNQATSILQGLGSLARLVELDELDRRVTALEGRRERP